MLHIKELQNGVLLANEGERGSYCVRVEDVVRIVPFGGSRFEVYQKGGARVVLWDTVDDRPPEYCFYCGQPIKGSKC